MGDISMGLRANSPTGTTKVQGITLALSLKILINFLKKKKKIDMQVYLCRDFTFSLLELS